MKIYGIVIGNPFNLTKYHKHDENDTRRKSS